MDIKKLQYFIAIAENLSFTAAAKELYITQPCLSLQIADLEKELGVKLFFRGKHSVQLTVAGTSILEEAKGVVAKVNEIANIARQAETGLTGKITLGYLGDAERKFLPQYLNYFRANYPKIALNLVRFANFADLDREIIDSNVDVAITIKKQTETLPLSSYKILYEDTLSLIVPAGYPFDADSDNPFESLGKETLFHIRREASGRSWDSTLQICAARGIKPKMVPVDNAQTVIMMVEAGQGFAILPHLVIESYSSKLLKHIPLSGEDVSINVIAAWKEDSYNPCIPIFLSALDMYFYSKTNSTGTINDLSHTGS
ncbi:MAG: hdfR 3 [Firmicutes bacterium]|nr:hdfR 3 [Bacillota bacterium]